jgi:uncharacterized protein YaaQ
MITFTAEHARAVAAAASRRREKLDDFVQEIVKVVQGQCYQGKQAVAIPMLDVAPKGSGEAHYVIAELQGAGYEVKWSDDEKCIDIFWHRMGAVSVNCVVWPALLASGVWASVEMADATWLKVLVVYVLLVCGGASGLWLLGAGLVCGVRKLFVWWKKGVNCYPAVQPPPVYQDAEEVEKNLEALEADVRKVCLAMSEGLMQLNSLGFILGLTRREMEELLKRLREKTWQAGEYKYKYETLRLPSGSYLKLTPENSCSRHAMAAAESQSDRLKGGWRS